MPASSKFTPPPGSVTTDAIPDGDLFRADILSARRTPPEQRVMDGLRLFEMSCEISKSGLRADHPEADEAEIARMLSDLLKRQRRIEEWGVYTYRPMTAEEAGLGDDGLDDDGLDDDGLDDDGGTGADA